MLPPLKYPRYATAYSTVPSHRSEVISKRPQHKKACDFMEISDPLFQVQFRNVDCNHRKQAGAEGLHQNLGRFENGLFTQVCGLCCTGCIQLQKKQIGQKTILILCAGNTKSNIIIML